ncbi:hypothetical protein [Thermococcus waiotapuensis]|uniref:Uncharacterized protein n=1 Tax=Thermococcus waiotapuensis TaxID=90909 RepID=A0AAE4NU82_9EURY|nr:hypothetical protein [Thermococcus waiotapuensis]MDV3103949.1 hypothetical protein [Thermococcus waiotapuensis]
MRRQTILALLLVLATGSIILAYPSSNIDTEEHPAVAMIGFDNDPGENVEGSILAINVDNVEPKVAREYINAQISKLRPVIVVGNPERVLHEILNSTDVVAVQVARIVDGKEIPINKVVIGYVPRKVGNKIGGKILSHEYTGAESVVSMYQKIKKIESEKQPVELSQSKTSAVRTIDFQESSGNFLGELSYSWEFSPYGILSVHDRLYMLGESNPTYNWFVYQFVVQTEPGDLYWKNGWRNADLWNSIDVDEYNPPSHLSDYSPTTTTGTSTVTVSVSASVADSPEVSAGMSWSYSISDVVVHDLSSFSRELASWWHDIDEGKFVGKDSFRIQPGALIRVPQAPGTYLWKVEYGGQWGKKKVGDYCIFGHCLSYHWDYSGRYGAVVIWGVKG